MLKLCDAVFNPPARTKEENDWRSNRFDVHIAKIGWGDTPMAGIKLEYLRPTYPERCWYRRDFPAPTIAESTAKMVEAWGLDGMFLDTPFENVPMPVLGVQAVEDIRVALGEKITCPNYGDMFTFMGEGALGAASVEMQRRCTWAMCEVAVNLEKPFNAGLWKRLHNHALAQLDLGKTLILGIHDLNGDKIAEALAIMHTLEHPNLYWKYYCGALGQTGQHASAYCWHPLFELARAV